MICTNSVEFVVLAVVVVLAAEIAMKQSEGIMEGQQSSNQRSNNSNRNAKPKPQEKV